ncbi:conserved Plasmodium protein, unknown function [Plasmodium sp. gorilla clade G2]|uniref:conserved Plasmodium protein, unknown function n=1 Tax=Plasmodium sp. gorilla clade G2 TaxID=880535 RepID=UPI000D215269|nr:conserved Plasmodium protein, unknown function [Plasmodium sp. gorilla clade G2]SOV13708.1 conserved Plasmodium protein, unknown function [Plasmodium sp. gorilla clade G2]
MLIEIVPLYSNNFYSTLLIIKDFNVAKENEGLTLKGNLNVKDEEQSSDKNVLIPSEENINVEKDNCKELYKYDYVNNKRDFYNDRKDNNIYILINCGWDDKFCLEDIKNVIRVCEVIDLIIITNHNLNCIGCLPVVFMELLKRNKKVPIICHEYIKSYSKYILLSYLKCNYNCEYFKNFKENEYIEIINNLYENIIILEFMEHYVFKKVICQKTYIEYILPLYLINNGDNIGSSAVILKLFNNKILYSINCNLEDYSFIEKSHVIKESNVFTYISNFHYSNKNCTKMMDMKNILNTVNKTINKMGCVLLPVDIDSIFIDLLFHINALLEVCSQRYMLLFLCPYGENFIRLLFTSLTYMNVHIKNNFHKNRINLFKIKNLICLKNYNDFKKYEDTYYIMFSFPSTLNNESVKRILSTFLNKEENLILFTKEQTGQENMSSNIWEHFSSNEQNKEKEKTSHFNFSYVENIKYDDKMLYEIYLKEKDNIQNEILQKKGEEKKKKKIKRSVKKNKQMNFIFESHEEMLYLKKENNFVDKKKGIKCKKEAWEENNDTLVKSEKSDDNNKNDDNNDDNNDDDNEDNNEDNNDDNNDDNNEDNNDDNNNDDDEIYDESSNSSNSNDYDEEGYFLKGNKKKNYLYRINTFNEEDTSDDDDNQIDDINKLSDHNESDDDDDDFNHHINNKGNNGKKKNKQKMYRTFSYQNDNNYNDDENSSQSINDDDDEQYYKKELVEDVKDDFLKNKKKVRIKMEPLNDDNDNNYVEEDDYKISGADEKKISNNIKKELYFYDNMEQKYNQNEDGDYDDDEEEKDEYVKNLSGDKKKNKKRNNNMNQTNYHYDNYNMKKNLDESENMSDYYHINKGKHILNTNNTFNNNTLDADYKHQNSRQMINKKMAWKHKLFVYLKKIPTQEKKQNVSIPIECLIELYHLENYINQNTLNTIIQFMKPKHFVLLPTYNSYYSFHLEMLLHSNISTYDYTKIYTFYNPNFYNTKNHNEVFFKRYFCLNNKSIDSVHIPLNMNYENIYIRSIYNLINTKNCQDDKFQIYKIKATISDVSSKNKKDVYENYRRRKRFINEHSTFWNEYNDVNYILRLADDKKYEEDKEEENIPSEDKEKEKQKSNERGFLNFYIDDDKENENDEFDEDSIDFSDSCLSSDRQECILSKDMNEEEDNNKIEGNLYIGDVNMQNLCTNIHAVFNRSLNFVDENQIIINGNTCVKKEVQTKEQVHNNNSNFIWRIESSLDPTFYFVRNILKDMYNNVSI